MVLMIFLETFGYAKKEKQGVYYSNHSMLDVMPIISLNELPDQPHNLCLQTFSSGSHKTIMTVSYRMC